MQYNILWGYCTCILWGQFVKIVRCPTQLIFISTDICMEINANLSIYLKGIHSSISLSGRYVWLERYIMTYLSIYTYPDIWLIIGSTLFSPKKMVHHIFTYYYLFKYRLILSETIGTYCSVHVLTRICWTSSEKREKSSEIIEFTCTIHIAF